jgi:hypothetical protein
MAEQGDVVEEVVRGGYHLRCVSCRYVCLEYFARMEEYLRLGKGSRKHNSLSLQRLMRRCGSFAGVVLAAQVCVGVCVGVVRYLA